MLSFHLDHQLFISCKATLLMTTFKENCRVKICIIDIGLYKSTYDSFFTILIVIHRWNYFFSNAYNDVVEHARSIIHKLASICCWIYMGRLQYPHWKCSVHVIRIWDVSWVDGNDTQTQIGITFTVKVQPLLNNQSFSSVISRINLIYFYNYQHPMASNNLIWQIFVSDTASQSLYVSVISEDDYTLDRRWKVNIRRSVEMVKYFRHSLFCLAPETFNRHIDHGTWK